jgi:hypothetical protein
MDIGSATSIAAMAIATSQANTGAQVLAQTLQKTGGAAQGGQAAPAASAVSAGKGQHINIKA